MMKRQSGFTLIEVIVAFALLALALTLLLASLSGAARQVHRADQRGRAALYAQSLMAGLGIESPLVPTHRSGELDDGRYGWTLDVRPYRDPHLAERAVGTPVVLETTLVVSWGDGAGEHLRVHSLRLAQPELTSGTMP